MPRSACSASTTGCQRQCSSCVVDRRGEPLHALARLLDRLHVLLEGDLLRRLRQLQMRDPAPMRLRSRCVLPA